MASNLDGFEREWIKLMEDWSIKRSWSWRLCYLQVRGSLPPNWTGTSREKFSLPSPCEHPRNTWEKDDAGPRWDLAWSKRTVHRILHTKMNLVSDRILPWVMVVILMTMMQVNLYYYPSYIIVHWPKSLPVLVLQQSSSPGRAACQPHSENNLPE